MNKLKMSLLSVFIFGCVSVNAQMPHFIREKPHKPKTLVSQVKYEHVEHNHSTTATWPPAYSECPVKDCPWPNLFIEGRNIKWIKVDTLKVTRRFNLPDSTIEEIRILRFLNDSLQKKLDKLVTFYCYVCPIMDALHLTDENKFQFKRAELAKRYRLYLEYYEPEYIANARKRQRH